MIEMKECKICHQNQAVGMCFKVNETTGLPHAFCNDCRSHLRYNHNSNRARYFGEVNA